MKIIYWFFGELSFLFSGSEYSVSNYFLVEVEGGNVKCFRVAKPEDFFNAGRFLKGDACIFRIGLMRNVEHRTFRLFLKDGDLLLIDPNNCEVLNNLVFDGVIDSRGIKSLTKWQRDVIYGYRMLHGDDLTVDVVKSLLGSDVSISEVEGIE